MARFRAGAFGAMKGFGAWADVLVLLLYYCTIIHGHFIVISWFWAVFYMVIPLYYIVLLYHMPIGFDQMSWGNTAQILCDKQLELLGVPPREGPSYLKTPEEENPYTSENKDEIPRENVWFLN